MAEWLIEHGIGEIRAALIDRDHILEARIIPDGELIAGSIVLARLIARMPERGQGVVAWEGNEALIAPLPVGVTQGAETLVEITRPAIPEAGKPKRARARLAGAGAVVGAPAALPEGRIIRSTDADLFEAAGWSELLEQAALLAVTFDGGSLTLHPTPAMTLVDIDGWAPPSALAVTGARAAADAIRRLDIAGSIGIDLPSTADKASRHAAAAAIDAAVPQPFERTAVNGFGFVQIVRPRSRRSLSEIYAMEAPVAHARALLRRTERTTGAGERTITAHPSVIAEIDRRPAWTDELARRTGTTIALRADAALAISAGHVQARFA